MNDLPTLEHALYGDQDAGGYRFLARSPGFLDAWLPQAERLCAGLGERPPGVACPSTIFVQPFGRGLVAVVQAADQGQDDQGRPGALGFYLVVIPASLYAHLGGDPFSLARSLPPPWSARGALDPLPCPELSGRRTVAEIRKVLDVPHSATLLGGAQALLDGGRVVFERSAPDETMLQGLWALLPTSTRKELWPASFAFGNTLGFDALVVPRLEPEMFSGYVLEEHAGDYPEGRYELALQTAAESGDQETLDALFSRRSGKETIKLGLILLAIISIIPLVSSLWKTGPPRNNPPEQKEKQTAGANAFELPGPEAFPPLGEAKTRALTAKLQALAVRVGARTHLSLPATVLTFGATVPGCGTAPLQTATLLSIRDAVPAELLNDIDIRLGTPNPKRKGRALWRLGPVERQLRGLLYKHEVEGYKDLRLSPAELVERLEEKLSRDRRLTRER
jgi:hypothetical protein